MLGIPWAELGFIAVLLALGTGCALEGRTVEPQMPGVFDWQREGIFDRRRSETPDELDDPARASFGPWCDESYDRTAAEIEAL